MEADLYNGGYGRSIDGVEGVGRCCLFVEKLYKRFGLRIESRNLPTRDSRESKQKEKYHKIGTTRGAPEYMLQCGWDLTKVQAVPILY